MARNETVAAAIGRYLRKSEKPLAAGRAAPRRSVTTTALLAGVGAAAGYTVSTFLGDDTLTAALGAAFGVVVGLMAASMVSNFRMRRAAGIRAAVVTMVLTRQRLLMFRQSWFNNRAVELVREYPLGSVDDVSVGPSKFVSPHPITIAFTDGSILRLEAAKYEEPGKLAEAFADAKRP